MKIQINRIDNDYLMEAKSENGSTIRMEASEAAGGHNQAMTPMQAVLSAIGGCSAIDIISILKKQRQNIASFEVEVDGDSVKRDEYSYFKTITVWFKIRGEVDPVKARRAADLSINKYCSVSKALEYASEIRFMVEVNGVSADAL